jgi:hypothetical protein
MGVEGRSGQRVGGAKTNPALSLLFSLDPRHPIYQPCLHLLVEGTRQRGKEPIAGSPSLSLLSFSLPPSSGSVLTAVSAAVSCLQSWA